MRITRVKKDPNSSEWLVSRALRLSSHRLQSLRKRPQTGPTEDPKAARWLDMREVVDILGGRPPYPKPEEGA